MSEEVSTSVEPVVAAPAPCPSTPPEKLARINLSEQQLDTISHDELVRLWRIQDSFIDVLEAQTAAHEAEITTCRETEERLKQQHSDLILREKVLVRRLASKEQEIQEYAGQLSELKAAQAPGAIALRQALLDPAVNLLLQRLRQELMTTRTRLEETQNELSAWKFTPDSNTGKRLMAKCRLLYQENEELGRMISSGRLAKLEGDLALQKSFSEEVKKSQSEMDEFLQDLDEDVEGMQSTIYYLQQELRKAKDSVVSLEQENNSLRTGGGGAVRSGASGGPEESQVNLNPTTNSSAPVNGIKDDAIGGRSEPRIKHEERTNGLKEDWGNPQRDEDSSIDPGDNNGGLVVKSEPVVVDLVDTSKSGAAGQVENSKDCVDTRTTNVVNNSSPVSRKRTTSEESDDVPLSKKIKSESSLGELSLHYNKDDELTIVNGDVNSVVLNNSNG